MSAPLRRILLCCGLPFWMPGCGPSELPPDQVEAGKKCFESYCSPCHLPGGEGADGRVPPLLASPWLAGSEERLVRILLHGVRGAITVGDRTFNLEMPAFGSALDDRQIGALLSYVRFRYGGRVDPVGEATVRRIRASTAGRKTYWTAPELLEIR